MEGIACHDHRNPESSEPAPATTTTPASGGSSRLRNGGLRRMVARFLADHTGDYAPREIARKLDRSSGAVGNALAALASKGEAEQTTEKPLRYRATATTAAAATGPTPADAAPARTPRTSAPARPRRSASAHTTEPATTRDTATSTGGAARISADEPVTGPVTRPNGQTYHPRKLSGLPDVAVLRKLRAAGVPALLYGPPGTGKTSVVEAAFPDLVTVAGDGDTTVGEYTQTPDGRYVFVYGPVVTAMAAVHR